MSLGLWVCLLPMSPPVPSSPHFAKTGLRRVREIGVLPSLSWAGLPGAPPPGGPSLSEGPWPAIPAPGSGPPPLWPSLLPPLVWPPWSRPELHSAPHRAGYCSCRHHGPLGPRVLLGRALSHFRGAQGVTSQGLVAAEQERSLWLSTWGFGVLFVFSLVNKRPRLELVYLSSSTVPMPGFLCLSAVVG